MLSFWRSTITHRNVYIVDNFTGRVIVHYVHMYNVKY